MTLAEYDAFEHIIDALCVAPDTPVAVLTAYFDEAGTDSSKPALAVACYIASNEQWKCFNLDWERLKGWHGVKKYFRRTDQESFWLHEDTQHWDKDQRRIAFQAQHALIHAHTLKGIACTVIKEDYDDAIKDADRQALGNAYEFCLRHCMAQVANYLATQPENDEILYVIESGAEGEGHLRHAFDLFLADPGLKKAHRLKGVDTWAFVSKAKAMPLQAADALAYEVSKEMESRFGTSNRPTRKSFFDLFRSEADEIAYWPKRGLLEACRRVHDEIRWPFKGDVD